jgi:hypothetical protein
MSIATSNGPLGREEQVREILKCGKNAVYFMKNYAKIQHPKRGLIPFDTYYFQDDCIKAFEENRFNIVLKSRQLGLSTVTAAYAVWYAIFKKDKNVLVIATKLQTAMNFIKKVKTILDGLPKWLLLTKFESTKQQITFANGSVIAAVPTSPDAGRSEALSLLIVDEAAFIRDFEEIWTGLYPTISTGGSAIIISTPNGVGGMYYKLWTDAIAQVNEFNTINLPWHVHPEHDQAWFDKETKNLPKRKVAQEFLCDFISSGDTFLQPTEMDYLRSMIDSPIRKEGPQNAVWIWSDPEPGKKYVISSDVARGDAADYSTMHVIDVNDCEVVAEYMGKIPPDKLADLLADYGKKYNTALLCPERNNFGYMTAVRLRDIGYKRLYYRNMTGDMFEYISSDPEAIPGFETQGNTRPQILAKLEEIIRNKIVKIYSQRFYDQMQAFIWQGSKAQATRDSHDDLIMSLAIGIWLTNGGSGVNEQAHEMAMAMLKATQVARRDSAQMPGDIQSAQPLINPNIRGVNPYNVHKPRDPSQIKNADVSDFSWLLR